jgi:hypothetical protein
MLIKDGITMASIEKFQIGFNPKFMVWDWEKEEHYPTQAITFPAFYEFRDRDHNMMGRYCVNIRHRCYGIRGGGGKYRPFSNGLGMHYFLAYDRRNQDFVITEGEKKAIVLYQYGFNSLGLWGIETFQDSWLPDVRRWIKNAISAAIVFDHEADETKRKHIWDVGKRLAEKLGIPHVKLPMPGKVDDLLVQGKISPEKFSMLIADIEIV